MRKTFLLVASVAALVVVAGGMALAATRQCDSPADCRGTEMADRMFGNDGENLIHSEGGVDVVHGRDGSDTLKGGPGKDELYGQAGDDTIKGGDDGDHISAGSGDDDVDGGTPGRTNDGDRDVLNCGPGVDTVHFTPGTDVVKSSCEIRNPPGQ